jgi:dipeptidyl aminopeptidase/acylaminoacyl peptidase
MAKGGSLIQLTQSGHDIDPKWSPDGRWIAFLSDRKASPRKRFRFGDDDKDKGERQRNKTTREKSARSTSSLLRRRSHSRLTQGEEEVHAFSWSADSRIIYFATRNPWTKAQKDDYKKQWKDVVQYRTAERGDTIFALDVAAALARHAAAPAAKEKSDAEKESDLTPGARAIATSPLRVDDLITSPTAASSPSSPTPSTSARKNSKTYEIYALDVARASSPAPMPAAKKSFAHATPPLTHNQAVEGGPRWANDSRHVFFSVEVGDVNRPLSRSPTASLLGRQRN